MARSYEAASFGLALVFAFISPLSAQDFKTACEGLAGDVSAAGRVTEVRYVPAGPVALLPRELLRQHQIIASFAARSANAPASTASHMRSVTRYGCRRIGTANSSSRAAVDSMAYCDWPWASLHRERHSQTDYQLVMRRLRPTRDIWRKQVQSAHICSVSIHRRAPTRVMVQSRRSPWLPRH